MRQPLLAALVLTLLLALVGCGGGSASPANSPSAPGGSGGGSPPPALPPGANFFSLAINKLADPWPTQLGVNFGIWRTLGASLTWNVLEPCQPADETNVNDPCYAWNTDTRFDNWMARATFNGQEVLYTAYYTPTWASQNPSDTCSHNLGLGGCWPPTDVDSGDHHWINFLTVLYQHVNSLPSTGGRKPHIKYWECWNEPDIAGEYAGTMAQLNTLCQDLHDTIHSLDSTTEFTTPAPTRGTNSGQLITNWLSTWIDSGYANDADFIAFHGYVCQGCAAEDEVPDDLEPLQTFLATSPVAAKPLWNTETGFGTEGVNPDPDLHAAFVARLLLLSQWKGVATVSYFGWDFGNIALINDVGSQNATLNAAGVAWQQIYNWTAAIGSSAPVCQNTGTIWQCTLSAKGTNYLIVWDTSQTSLPCPNGACGTTNFTVPAGYTEFDDLAGDTDQPISGGTVQIGMKPIRLH